MTVSTPSASELSADDLAGLIHTQRATAAILRQSRDGYDPSWSDHMDRVADALASQAKRIEELEGDCARKDELLTAAVVDYNAAKALLSEAEKVITPFAAWCPEILEITETIGGFWRVTLSEDAPRPLVADFGAAVDLLPKLREATK